MQEAWSILRPLLLEIVLPAVAASAATLLALSLICKRLSWPKSVEVLISPLAVAAGLVAGNLIRRDPPYWSLETDWNSLLPATLAMLFFAAVGEFHREAGRFYFGMISQVAGAILCAFWLTPVEVAGSRWLWIGVVFVAFRTNSFALSGQWHDSVGRGGLFSLALIWGGAVGPMLAAFSHQLRFFDFAALLSSSLLGAGMVIWFTKSTPRAAYAAAAIFFPALMLSAQVGSFSAVPAAAFLLMAIAPCVVLLALPELSTRMESWSAKAKLLTALILLVIPLAAALVMAAVSGANSPEA
jgi:hypothetical protein